LVKWVEKYLLQTHGKKQANIILDDIDWRCVFCIVVSLRLNFS
jgi:hypothetical protein